MNDLLLLSLCAAGIAVLLVAGVVLLWLPPLLPLLIRRLLLALLVGEILLGLLQLNIPLGDFSSVRWHLNLSAEYRLGGALVAAQLCIAGVVALLHGFRLARTDPDGRLSTQGYHLYWLVMGVGLIFLAADEFFVIHETIPALSMLYLLAAVVMSLLAILLLASGRRYRREFGLLIVGMTMMAAGGVLLDTVLEQIAMNGLSCGGPAWLNTLCESLSVHQWLLGYWGMLEEFSEMAGCTLVLGALLLLAQTHEDVRGRAFVSSCPGAADPDSAQRPE